MFRPLFTLSVAFALGGSALPARAQAGDDAVRVTVTMNPDGSKTVYQTDGASRRSTATTTGANGKAMGKIIYRLDANGRYESGEVFAANGTLRFKTRYRYDAAGHLLEEAQLAKDDSVQNRIVFTVTTRPVIRPATRFMMGMAVYLDARPRRNLPSGANREKTTLPTFVR